MLTRQYGGWTLTPPFVVAPSPRAQWHPNSKVDYDKALPASHIKGWGMQLLQPLGTGVFPRLPKVSKVGADAHHLQDIGLATTETKVGCTKMLNFSYVVHHGNNYQRCSHSHQVYPQVPQYKGRTKIRSWKGSQLCSKHPNLPKV